MYHFHEVFKMKFVKVCIRRPLAGNSRRNNRSYGGFLAHEVVIPDRINIYPDFYRGLPQLRLLEGEGWQSADEKFEINLIRPLLRTSYLSNEIKKDTKIS
jgi:hypothetical protein